MTSFNQDCLHCPYWRSSWGNKPLTLERRIPFRFDWMSCRTAWIPLEAASQNLLLTEYDWLSDIFVAGENLSVHECARRYGCLCIPLYAHGALLQSVLKTLCREMVLIPFGRADRSLRFLAYWEGIFRIGNRLGKLLGWKGGTGLLEWSFIHLRLRSCIWNKNSPARQADGGGSPSCPTWEKFYLKGKGWKSWSGFPPLLNWLDYFFAD